MRSKYMLIIAFCWLPVTITTAQIDQKPIGFWQFDEGKGGQATDVSGNKFQGFFDVTLNYLFCFQALIFKNG